MEKFLVESQKSMEKKTIGEIYGRIHEEIFHGIHGRISGGIL